MKHVLALLLLTAWPAWASAQTVWRCGPDGRSFSDTPCAEGQRLGGLHTAARPAADVSEARARAGQEQRLAQALRQERLREEAGQRGSGMAALGPSAPERLRPQEPSLGRWQTAQTQQPRRAGPAAGETSRAVAPASRRKKG